MLRLAPRAASERSWARVLPKLRRFKSEFGHCDVPEGWAEDLQLAHWVSSVRGRHRAGTLRPAQTAALVTLGFSFEPRQAEWHAMVRALEAFKARFGHCAVPRWWKELPELGIWVSNVRTRYHNRAKGRGPGRVLSDLQVRQMDELGFFWHPQRDFSRIALAGLLAFRAKHGHTDVPRDFPDTQLKRALGQVKTRHRKGLLSSRDIRSFERLGFALVRPKPRSRWEGRLEQLRDFRARNGRVDVHRVDDLGLAAWLVNQRKAMRRDALDTEKAEQLASLGVHEQRTEDARFEQRLVELSEFKAARGHCRVPAEWTSNAELGRWCATMRLMRRQGRLRPARVAALEALGFDFEPYANDWAERFAELKAFQERFGHTEVPRFWKESPMLGPWVTNQRVAQKHGELSKERARRLEGLGFVWTPREAHWERMYAKLESFRDVHGHAAGPFTDTALSSWAGQQRFRRKLGKVSRERIRRLDVLGFAWRAVSKWTLEPYLDMAAEFRRRNGHLDIPNDARHESLFRWAQLQRGNYRRQRLEPNLRRELEAIGFPLTARDAKWEHLYAQLLGARGRTQRKGELSRWLASQRALGVSGALELDREARLRKLRAL